MKTNVRIGLYSMLCIMTLILPVSASYGLPWDANTISLLHFDKLNNHTLTGSPFDQTGKSWANNAPPTTSRISSLTPKFNENYNFSTVTDKIYMYSDQEGFYNATEFLFGTTSSWTAEGWFNITAYPSANQNATLITWLDFVDGTSTTMSGANLYINSAGKLVVTTPGSHTMTPYLTCAGSVPTNKWNSFALVKNAGTMRIYVNGSFQASLSTANSYNWSRGGDNIQSWGPDSMYPTIGQVQSGSSNGGLGGLAGHSVAPLGRIDEFRVSNTSRYSANYTPSATEFFNPHNQTTTFNILPATTVNVGEIGNINVNISNISYASTFGMSNIWDYPYVSVVSGTPASPLPDGWTVVYNTSGGEAIFYNIDNTKSVTQSTNIFNSMVSFDMPGTITPFAQTDKNTNVFSYSSSYFDVWPVQADASNNLARSYNDTIEITDLSASDSWLVLSSYELGSLPTINVGEKVNLTLEASFIFNVSGTDGIIRYNSSYWQVSNIYPVEPYYDLSYVIDNANGVVTFQALYPEFGGVTRYDEYPDICIPTSPAWCGYERYAIIEVYALPALVSPSTTDVDVANNEMLYTAGNPFLTAFPDGYTYSNYYSGTFNFTAGAVTDNTIVEHFRIIDINTGVPINGAATVTTSARDANPVSQSVVGGTFDIAMKGGFFNVSVTADGYYPTVQEFVAGVSGETFDIIVTPYGGPSTQTWYQPHQVSFKIMDINDNMLTNVFVNATAYESSLPGGLAGATDSLISMYGINAAEAAKMVSTATNMEGYTGDDGRAIFSMHGSLKYRIMVVDGAGNQYIKTIYPLNNEYIIRTTNSTVTKPENEPTRYDSIGNATLTFDEPNTSYMTTGLDYLDISGDTNYIQFYVKCLNNNTIVYNRNQTVTGQQHVFMNYTFKNVRGEQFTWWYDAGVN